MSAVWLSWDGRRLRWRLDSAQSLELHLDGVAFKRFDATGTEFDIDFPYSPNGCEELEFSLLRADGTALAPTWRVIIGRAGVPGVDQWHSARRSLRPLASSPLWRDEAAAREVAIVVPIHNSAPLVEACIASVLKWTSKPARLILIDDASDDPAIAKLLDRHAGHAGRIEIVRNQRNLGYTRSTNIGIERSGTADVVFLNSDTEVGPLWLDRLRALAYSDATIGTVTAVSDNAGAFSVPEMEKYCPIPAAWTLEQAQRALLHDAGGSCPELPTGNGFCMYVKRAMLEKTGLLDAEGFPFGYGEENDLCQRGVKAGFRHVIAGDVLVRHARSASFGDERRLRLGKQGMAVLRSRYPQYENDVAIGLASFARRVLDYRVRRIYGDPTAMPRARVLIAGADDREAKLMSSTLHSEYECFVLQADRETWRLCRIGDDTLATEAESEDVTALRDWLRCYAIEFVHVVSDRAETPGVRTASTSAGVPVVTMSLRDTGGVWIESERWREAYESARVARLI